MFELQTGERVLRTCRRHWLVFLGVILQVSIPMVLVLAVPFVVGVTGKNFPAEIELFIPLAAVLFFEVLWVLLFLVITDYYLDVWLITNQHLIFIELHGIFNRTMSSVNLTNIQDVSVDVHGLIPTLFGFGDINIQSAGTAGMFTFRQVPDPYRVKDIILSTREKALSSEVKAGLR